jgi:hypothetical protein
MIKPRLEGMTEIVTSPKRLSPHLPSHLINLAPHNSRLTPHSFEIPTISSALRPYPTLSPRTMGQRMYYRTPTWEKRGLCNSRCRDFIFRQSKQRQLRRRLLLEPPATLPTPGTRMQGFHIPLISSPPPNSPIAVNTH